MSIRNDLMNTFDTVAHTLAIGATLDIVLHTMTEIVDITAGIMSVTWFGIRMYEYFKNKKVVE